MRQPTGPFRRADETFHDSAGTKKHSMYAPSRGIVPAVKGVVRAVSAIGNATAKVAKGAVKAVDKVYTGVENRMKKMDETRRLRDTKLMESAGFRSFEDYNTHMAGTKKKR